MAEAPLALPAIAAAPYDYPFDGIWSAADTALLLLGFQEVTVDRLQAHAEVAVARSLVEATRAAGISIITTRASLGHGPLALRRAEAADAPPAVGSAGWDLVAALRPRAGETVIDHVGDEAFHASPLEQLLGSRGIRNLILAGLATDGMVHATMRAANDRGFECLVVSNACRGTTVDRHHAILRITMFGNGLFGTVADVSAILRAMKQYVSG
jgi:nicotinamidase-related amidase